MRGGKLFSGLLAFYPALAFIAAIPFVVAQINSPDPGDLVGFMAVLHVVKFVLLGVYVFQICYFLHHLFVVNEVLEKKSGWALGMIGYGPLCTPFYWYKFMHGLPNDFYDDDYGMS